MYSNRNLIPHPHIYTFSAKNSWSTDASCVEEKTLVTLFPHPTGLQIITISRLLLPFSQYSATTVELFGKKIEQLTHPKISFICKLIDELAALALLLSSAYDQAEKRIRVIKSARQQY